MCLSIYTIKRLNSRTRRGSYKSDSGYTGCTEKIYTLLLLSVSVVIKVRKFSWRTRYKYKRCIMSIQNTRPQWYTFYITAIRLRYLRILVLSNCQKRDPLPLSDPSRSQIQSQDRRHPWHPVLSGQLVLQHFWSERYVHKSNNEPIRQDDKTWLFTAFFARFRADIPKRTSFVQGVSAKRTFLYIYNIR